VKYDDRCLSHKSTQKWLALCDFVTHINKLAVIQKNETNCNMTEFDDFEKGQKSFLNGKVSQFMDVYIRKNKVWTAEQIQSDFREKTLLEIENGVYEPDPKYDDLLTLENRNLLNKKLEAIKWLTSENGKVFSINRFNQKIQKDKPIADRKSPIVEKIRFGFNRDENYLFDINYGLKGRYSYVQTSELEKINYLPWTIEHVNSELKEKYNCNIFDCLEKLSTSYLEAKFVEYWKQNYASDNKNPAIIPEVCGLKSNFYYFTHNENIYTQKSEIREEITSRVKISNFRYDFLVVNFKNQKIAFIELDGFEHHKTRQQQTIDSIKRNSASKNKIVLFTFTSKRINEDLKSVFNELESYLT
jgi:hypothetical protein